MGNRGPRWPKTIWCDAKNHNFRLSCLSLPAGLFSMCCGPNSSGGNDNVMPGVTPMLRKAPAFFVLIVLCSLLQAQTKPAADLIITNAKIWTVDKTRPHAEALAVLGDRIVAVGSATEVDTWHGPQTKVLDA